MPEKRRHIALLFSDIMGYTSLMVEDEDKALNLLTRNRTIHETQPYITIPNRTVVIVFKN